MVTCVAPLTDGDLRDGLRAMLAGEVVRTVYRVDGAPLPGAA